MPDVKVHQTRIEGARNTIPALPQPVHGPKRDLPDSPRMNLVHHYHRRVVPALNNFLEIAMRKEFLWVNPDRKPEPQQSVPRLAAIAGKISALPTTIRMDY